MPLIGYDTAGGAFIVPADAQWVACYRDGHYVNEQAARHRFPHLADSGRVLSITVLAGDADCVDIEPGNVGPDSAVGFVRRQLPHVHRPCLYADRSDMEAIAANLRGAGVDLSITGPARTVRLWVAHPNGIQHICGPNTCGFPIEADATQFWFSSIQGRWHGFTGDLDVSLARDDFFAPLSPTPPPPEDYVSVSSTRNADGRIEVFVEAKDGSIWHTWQTAPNNGWEGAVAGQHAAQLVKLADAPVK